jgi:hypothetical protein
MPFKLKQKQRTSFPTSASNDEETHSESAFLSTRQIFKKENDPDEIG